MTVVAAVGPGWSDPTIPWWVKLGALIVGGSIGAALARRHHR